MFHADTSSFEWLKGKTYYAFEAATIRDYIKYTDDEDIDDEDSFPTLEDYDLASRGNEKAEEKIQRFCLDHESMSGLSFTKSSYHKEVYMEILGSWEYNDGGNEGCSISREQMNRAFDALDLAAKEC